MDYIKSKLTEQYPNLVDNLSGAIQSLNLHNYRNKTKVRILDSPWVRLPNVKDFNIELRPYDLLFKAIEVKKKLKPKMKFEAYINDPINRYAENQIRRLSKLRKYPNKYWSVSFRLLRRSNTFRVMGINHVMTNWHRNYPLEYVINVNRRLSKLINKGSTNAEFDRVYIEKGDGRLRPLGVPRMEWRIYSHMLNNFLYYFLKPTLSNRQHGFMPGRGVITAWKQFMEEKVMDAKFIYEYDFVSFFDTCELSCIARKLEEKGVPYEVNRLIYWINRSTPKFKEYKPEVGKDLQIMRKKIYDRLTEVKDNNLLLEEGYDYYKYGERPSFISWVEPGTENLVDKIIGGVHGQPYETPEGLKRDNPFSRNLSLNGFDSIKPFNRGVPQGMPTSPLLSSLVMEEWINNSIDKSRTYNTEDLADWIRKWGTRDKIDITMESSESKARGKSAKHITRPNKIVYADDSIAYHNTEFEEFAPRKTGIEINKSKSGWVKYEGQWIKPLKFLGMTFDGETFRASTRKGSDLKLSKEMRVLMDIIEEKGRNQNYTAEEILKLIDKREDELLKGKYSPADSWVRYFKSRILGFCFSRIFIGKWNLEDFKQDFTLRWVNKSWIDSRHNNSPFELNVFNSSSVAVHSLLEIFRSNQKLRRNRKEGRLVIRWVNVETKPGKLKGTNPLRKHGFWMLDSFNLQRKIWIQQEKTLSLLKEFEEIKKDCHGKDHENGTDRVRYNLFRSLVIGTVYVLLKWRIEELPLQLDAYEILKEFEFERVLLEWNIETKVKWGMIFMIVLILGINIWGFTTGNSDSSIPLILSTWHEMTARELDDILTQPRGNLIPYQPKLPEAPSPQMMHGYFERP